MTATHLHRVEQARPFINGKCFSDIYNIPDDLLDKLIDREMVYITEFEWTGQDGKTALYGGHIIAVSKDQACELAKARGLGEIVIGMLVEAVRG